MRLDAAVAPGRARHVLRGVALAAVLLAIVLATTARGSLRLPAILGDHMVLQRDHAVLWGTATPGHTITAAIAGVQASAIVDVRGAWHMVLDGLAAGGPHDLTLDGDGQVVVHDVLIGDVWLGAGQSNMALAVRTASDGAPPASADDCRRLRFFTVERAASAVPLRDVRGRWRVCTPESAASFSAAAYFFGQDLAAALDVPVGLVVTAWGSTAIAVWLGDGGSAAATPPGLTAATGGTPFALSVADLRLVPINRGDATLPIALEPGQGELGGDWRARAKPGSTARWSALGDEPHGAQFSGELADPDAWASATTTLLPGRKPIDLRAIGAVAFRARGNGAFGLTLGQDSIRDGDAYASAPIVAGEAWTPHEIVLDALKQGGWGVKQPFARDALTTLGFAISAPAPQDPGVAFNAMVAPLAPLRVRGVLWYQGEADVARAAEYAGSLRALVTGWRDAWHDASLPFVVVQLPGYGPPAGAAGDSAWAELRDAQATIGALPATTLVPTLDLGDAQDIHPRRKRALGQRLAHAVRQRVYDPSVDSTSGSTIGPRLDVARLSPDGRVALTFADTGGGLTTRDGTSPSCFALSADGRRFVRADAQLTTPSTIEVSSSAIGMPVEVRYAWADNPVCNLAGGDGLPAAPFHAVLGGDASTPASTTSP
jgi:sialate O-acetylesterase